MSMTVRIVHEPPEVLKPETTNTNPLLLDGLAFIDSDVSFFVIEE